MLACPSFGKEQNELLPEGFMLSGVEGEILFDDTKEVWFVELSSDVNNSFSTIGAGTKLPLLPSSTLEKISLDVNKQMAPYYRLWGQVTKYKNQNYIFPSHFFPIAEASSSKMMIESQDINNFQETAEEKISISEANDAIVIPKNILEKLSSRKIVRTELVKEKSEVTVDTVISERMAVLEKVSDNNFVFVLDSIGRNISGVSLRVLPSQALELTEKIQASVSEKLHFKISGLLTNYKGEQYLLLQKANRVYSYQNFAK
jgi:hypothetical protein